jgi:PPP family 3-phenylpropionic acid transporter
MTARRQKRWGAPLAHAVVTGCGGAIVADQVQSRKVRRPDVQVLTALYFLYFFSYGVYQPYINLHFRRLGMPGSQIGVLAALRPLLIIFVPPFVGYVADQRHAHRRALGWLLMGSVVPFYLLLGTHDFRLLLLTMFAFSAFTSAITPMLDTNALDVLAGDRTRYGLLRRWGSLGYMIAVVVCGQLGERSSIPTLLAASGVVLLLAGCVAWHWGRQTVDFPSLSVSGLDSDTSRRWWSEMASTWGEVLRLPGMAALLAAGFLGWVASSTYQIFFTIHADALGMSEGLIGVAWGIAVVSEIVFLSLSRRFLTHWGARTLFAVGLSAAALRWSLYAVVENVYLVLGLQMLHGLTFGALQVGAVTYLHAQAPPERRSGAQTLWVALTTGVAGAIGAFAGGPLSDALGIQPLFALSGILALAGALVGWFGVRTRT